MQNNNEHIEDTIDVSEVMKVRREKLSALQAEGMDPFSIKKYTVDCHSSQVIENYDELEGREISCAGRIIAKRIMGKASFCHIQDRDGKVQLYVRRDVLGEEPYAHFKKMDIGDIIGVKGEVFTTNMGEKSIKAHEITLLSKSLQPLPEKWHGLKDTDLRYRHRYTDLVVNPDVINTFVTRSKIMAAIREFMNGRGFMEVETPVLHNHTTNAAARPFRTHHNTLDIDMFLRVELELHLKRLIVGGLEKVYEIGRIFRNEGMSYKHNPEFTMIEIYEAYTDYNGMMELTENLFGFIADNVIGSRKIQYQGMEINLESPWTRMTMEDAVKKFTGVDFASFDKDDAKAAEEADNHGVHFREGSTWGEILNEFFEQKVEENLVQPTFIYDYPIEISPLAKSREDRPHLTERFEVFITSRELGNAFTELNDPIEQKERFIDQAKKKAGDDGDYSIDYDFINALEIGMPPTGGLGIGVDRMIMLFTDNPSIRDVILFPTMKPVEE
ncbi:MAG TPA: lysine--tRNA ligase [Clostridia bacterium]|nr:lysine--tRNA ligase [Clostridia bacterium]